MSWATTADWPQGQATQGRQGPGLGFPSGTLFGRVARGQQQQRLELNLPVGALLGLSRGLKPEAGAEVSAVPHMAQLRLSQMPRELG